MIEKFEVHNLVRANIFRLSPYSTARHEFNGVATVMMDANENAMGSPVSLNIDYDNFSLNRYPDPAQTQLKDQISIIKGVPVENIFVGNGSDEAIDVLLRIFCNPGTDNIITLTPTYGMYSVAAAINDIKINEIPLDSEFQMDIQSIADAIDDHTKIIFLCSPNNPTGNSINRQDIEIILNNFDGIVVLDEAYINYAKQKSFVQEVKEHPNLVVLQTLSKAWGMAALRVGFAFASKEIIHYMNNVKYPYNVNISAQELALKGVQEITKVNEWTKQTVEEREKLATDLLQFPFVQKVYPSDANFLLVKMEDTEKVFNFLQLKGVIVRNRNSVKGCEGCLRITIGTPEENKVLLNTLTLYQNK